MDYQVSGKISSSDHLLRLSPSMPTARILTFAAISLFKQPVRLVELFTIGINLSLLDQTANIRESTPLVHYRLFQYRSTPIATLQTGLRVQKILHSPCPHRHFLPIHTDQAQDSEALFPGHHKHERGLHAFACVALVHTFALSETIWRAQHSPSRPISILLRSLKTELAHSCVEIVFLFLTPQTHFHCQ